MAYIDSRYFEHQRKRFTRNNAHLYIRHDAYRFAPPGSPRYSGKDVVRYFEPVAGTDPPSLSAKRIEISATALGDSDGENERLAFRHEVSKLRLDFELLKFALKAQKGGFNPDQPRDGHGRWTDGGGTDVSAAKKLPPIVEEFGKWTVRRFISQMCRGSVNSELPTQFENMTITEIWNIAKGGDARARTCLKLLQRKEYRK
jgi:hypothetical protein